MENYKKTLIKRIWLLAVLVLFAVCVLIINVSFASIRPKIPEVLGFQCSLSATLGAFAVFTILRLSIILHNDRMLQIEYNREKDERMKAIRSKAGMPILLITSILMIAAGILFGYSNIMIFYTLTGAAAVQLVISCIVKFVYMKIM